MVGTHGIFGDLCYEDVTWREHRHDSSNADQLAEDHPVQVHHSQERARNELIETLTGPEDDYVFTSSVAEGPSFHGRFAGLSMLRTVRDLCTTISGSTDTPDDLSGKALAEAFDSTMLDLPSYNRMAQFALLPSRERLLKTITVALDCALVCKECVDRGRLYQEIDHLYNRDPEDYTSEDRRVLGLLYALMALGRRHDPDPTVGSVEPGAEMIVLRGVTYFRAARAIIDATDCHDLNSVRALIAMASYLLSSSMLSKAYSYLCTAAAACLRMGLHVSSTALRGKFTPAELSERRQVFSVLYLADIYVSSTLGMPNVLRDADPDQTIPCPEEEMHDLGKSFVERDPQSPLAQTILAAKLFRIQGTILQSCFPMANFAHNEERHLVRYQEVVDRAAELQAWHETLPDTSLYTADHRFQRAQLLLRFSYASVQITLYRPFLHHVIRDRREPNFDEQGYAFGVAGLRAATSAVWVIDTMDRHGYLHEALWWSIYTLALAASSLTLHVLGTKDGAMVVESRGAALRARELLSKLGTRNVSARRCYESLARLPESWQPPPPSSGGTFSPRTQFMLGIGAIDPSVFASSVEDAMGGDVGMPQSSSMSTSD